MAIGKPRGKKGTRPVYVYDPRVGRKRYVGSRRLERDAKQLFRDKSDEFAALSGRPRRARSVREYALRWLDVKHGEGTRRPSATTRQVNDGLLRPFLREFGDRRLDGGISRAEALDWALRHPTNAKAVSAMFNDAVDDMLAAANPFANRRQPESRGRRDIDPITEEEVERLGELALRIWGERTYGLVVRGWVLFSAWVGTRPGETFSREWRHLDFDQGLVTVERIKGRKQVDTVVLPDRAAAAVLAMPVRREGLVFRSIRGKPITKGSSRYGWDPVRKAFMAELSAERRRELLAGREDLDIYELRHFCGSIMADRGLTEFDIAHQLGNSPEVCRETYIHTYVDRANDRVKMALNDTIASLDAHRKRKHATDGQQPG